MILRSGAEIDAKFGARPVFEADLIAVVKSSAIHDAKTPLEALALNRADLRAAVMASPELGWTLLQTVAERLDG